MDVRRYCEFRRPERKKRELPGGEERYDRQPFPLFEQLAIKVEFYRQFAAR